jgi:outer membrane protein OmpA-like peptidoglycan-associated protein
MILFVLAVAPQPVSAQLGKLKDKIKKEAQKKIPVPQKPEPASADTTEGAPATPASDSAEPSGDQFQLFTKFDFVPGQRVLFCDDLAREELGEFPSRWGLTGGVFEVAKVGADPWIMCSARGQIYPKLNVNQLPEKYTVEFKTLNRAAPYTGAFYVQFFWLGADGYPVAELKLFSGITAYFYMKDDQGREVQISDKKLAPSFETGIHDIRVMVTKSSVKCYVDNDRVANAPRTAAFTPTSFALGFHADDVRFEKEKLFLGDFRFAEGGKTMREQLDDSGKIVTHGIYFDVNSSAIKGESYKTLAEIGQMLTDDVALKLMIEGHTDSDGNDAANLTLSQKRAESVRQYLIENYKVDGARLEAKGHGETKPIEANTTPEGKANNRRVELVKI